MLEQFVNDAWQPLVFFSQRLRPPGTRYHTFDRKLLAVFLALRHFRYFLEGRQFCIYRPFALDLRSRTERTPRQTNRLSFIAEFTSDIRHLPGRSNDVADSLYRPSTNAMTITSEGFEDLARAQQEDNELHDIEQSITSLKWEWRTSPSGKQLLCDVSTGCDRPWVPSKMRRTIF